MLGTGTKIKKIAERVWGILSFKANSGLVLEWRCELEVG